MIEGGARWYAYILVLAVTVCIGVWSARRESRATSSFVGVSASIALPFAFQSLFNRWLGIGFEVASVSEFDTRFIAVAIGVIVILTMVVLWGYHLESLQLPIAAPVLVALATIAILNSRVGDLIVGFSTELWLFLPLLAVASRVLWKDLCGEHYVSSRFSNAATVVLLASSACLSIRIDTLNIDGTWYHLGYFTGVVQTVKAGGLLLWDTPSQYGFLNMLFASLLPFRDASNSFLYFQASLMFAVSLVVILAIREISMSRSWVFAAACFILMQYLADPELIGPQPFPSSSVMRFGPSVVVLALLSIAAMRRNHLLSSWALPVVGAVAMLWSFESFFYSSLILGGWFLATVQRQSIGHVLGSHAFKFLVRSLALMVLFVVCYSIYVLVRTQSLPSWHWFYLVASKYAEGHGALPINPWGAGLLIIAAIASCFLVLSVSDSQIRQLCGASVGALLGWLSYFIGRAHSSNIIAVFPLVYLAILLPSLAASRSLAAQRHESRVAEPVSLQDSSALSGIRMSGAIVVAFGAIVIASIGANSRLPNLINGFRPLSRPVVNEIAVTEAGAQLGNLMQTVDLRSIPVAYVGLLGSLPPLPDSVQATIDARGAWLPLPLALLEEPIPREVRTRILERRHKRFNQDGYFVWDKQRSIPGRAEIWLEDLSKTHICQVVVEDESWQVSECISR